MNHKTDAAGSSGQPVISVDTKKKELVGHYKNNGKEWRPQGEPELVEVYDFVNQELGRANPYVNGHWNLHAHGQQNCTGTVTSFAWVRCRVLELA